MLKGEDMEVLLINENTIKCILSNDELLNDYGVDRNSRPTQDIIKQIFQKAQNEVAWHSTGICSCICTSKEDTVEMIFSNRMPPMMTDPAHFSPILDGILSALTNSADESSERRTRVRETSHNGPKPEALSSDEYIYKFNSIKDATNFANNSNSINIKSDLYKYKNAYYLIVDKRSKSRLSKMVNEYYGTKSDYEESFIRENAISIAIGNAFETLADS